MFIKSIDVVFGKMNKMLVDFGIKGVKEGNGDMIFGFEKYWNLYWYKEEW